MAVNEKFEIFLKKNGVKRELNLGIFDSFFWHPLKKGEASQSPPM